MQKITFENLPSTNTPLNAANLNTMQTNIDNGKVESVQYSNIDLNSITVNSLGSFTSNCTNTPFNADGYIITQVIDSNTICQTAVNPSTGATYKRFKSSGTWGNWALDVTVEEGTWTPYISTVEGANPTISYTTQRGTYKKIGNLVYIDFYIRAKITALNGTNNYGVVAGLPYSAKNTLAIGENSIPIGVLYSLLENTTNVKLAVSGTQLRALYNNGAASDKLVVTSTSYCEIGGNGWYSIA